MRALAMRPRSCQLRSFVFLLGMLIPFFCSAQVYRCIVNGQVVYQQNSCESSGGKGGELHIDSAPAATLETRPSRSTGEPLQPAPQAEFVVPKHSPPESTPLERKVDRCLNWYGRLLRGGESKAAIRVDSFEKGILTITIFTSGLRGTTEQRTAACEFKGEALDDGWTQEHAKRLGW